MKEITLRDVLIFDLQTMQSDRERLDTITEPLEHKWISMRIANMERLLDQLDNHERLLINRIVIGGEKASALTEETGLTVRHIQFAKDSALDKLLISRHGAAYHP